MRNYLSILVFAFAPCLWSADSGTEFFEKKIRPVLAKNCYECHSGAAAKKGKLKGGLQLDTRAGIRKGGDSGAAVTPNKPEASLILFALRQEKNLEMPPRGKLPDSVIADFGKWLEIGAPDPRDGEAIEVVRVDDFEKAREFWSFRPVSNPSRPKVKESSWPRSKIDFFVAQKREAAGLVMADDSDPRVLVRRLYFDLIGLPPTPKDVVRWSSRICVPENRSGTPKRELEQGAIAELVAELLASARFGERWGRHWLDVARYADSNGQARNVLWHHAWRYRDWVIKAFNEDLPFNEFVKQQVAGDLLPSVNLAQRDGRLVAAGFMALGPKSVEERKKDEFTMDVIDEQIDIVTRGIIGLSVSCARCHDHKFDPVPTKDYYALAGILLSTKTLYGYGPPTIWNIDNDSGYRAIGPNVEELSAAAADHRTAVIAKTRERGKARSDRYRVVRRKNDTQRKLKSAKGDAQKEFVAAIKEQEAEIKEWDGRIEKMEEELLALQDNPPPQPGFAMSAMDQAEPEDCRIYIRGEVSTPGKKTPRGNLRFLDIPGIAPISSGQSGRLQWAEWLASDENPLTPRVFVNRVWQHLFGRGLVTTPDDFGKTGAKPTHPDLLDHLAAEFVAKDWSVKELIRAIVLSRTYQMGSAPNAANQAKDPENKWLWRMNPRRLPVEPYRDAILAVSGRLDLQPRERSVLAGYHEFKEFEFNSKTKITQERMKMDHRSVYLPVVRGNLPEMLELFDFANPDTLTGTRDETTVPAQSLFLMNGAWIIEQSRHLARRLLSEGDDDVARMRRLYELAYSRPSTAREVERGMQFIDSGDRAKQWAKLCQVVLASSEFRYLR
jgi:hypothetical protein